MRAAVLTLALLGGLPATAQELQFPAPAEQKARRVTDDSRFLPTAPYDKGSVKGIVAEGEVEQTTWVVGDGSLTTLELLAPLRDQLIAMGYKPLYECATRACGGFDFRFEIEVLPEPDMHVNLGDFRYFAARRGDEEEAEYVALLVSRSANSGFVQLTRIGEPEKDAGLTASTKTPSPSSTALPPEPGPLPAQLETLGHATLFDVTFRTGSSDLGDTTFETLDSLAAYLRANPDRTVMLVGHTDAEGALANNVMLSRRRAEAVMDRLIEEYGVPAEQVAADGVGFLAPRASNLTPEGRMRNRRVEVILTSTE